MYMYITSLAAHTALNACKTMVTRIKEVKI